MPTTDEEFERARAMGVPDDTNPETLEELAQLVADLKKEIKVLKDPKGSFRTPLTKQRNVDKLPTFSGESYLVYQDKIETFCEDEPGLRRMLKDAVKQLEVITAEVAQGLGSAAGVDAKTTSEYNRELLSLLKQTTVETPWNIVKGCEDIGGFEAWRIMNDTYARQTKKSRRNLLKAIMNPEKAKDDGGILGLASKWEINVARYEQAMQGKASKNFWRKFV